MGNNEQSGAAMVKKIVGEIAAMEYAGDVKAIAAVIVDSDGDIRTLMAFHDGFKIGIIAGCSVLQRGVLDQLQIINKAPKI